MTSISPAPEPTPKDPDAAQATKLINGRRLIRNVVWNLVGQVTPLVVAVGVIPILVRTLGVQRFGVLTIAWVVIGYFSLFDFGLGRALTQIVAHRLGAADAAAKDELPTLVHTALAVLVVVGMGGGVVAILISPWLVQTVLRVPTGLRPEAVATFYLLALSVPIVVASAGFRGVLDALQRFDLSNIVRASLGIATFLGPAIVLPFSRSLVALVAVLVAIRLMATGALLVFCLYAMPQLKTRIAVRLAAVPSLLRLGGWMAVSNVLGPLMVYVDRFFIGAMLSLAAVTYYATPYEAVTKLLVLSGALAGVLFPALSTAVAKDRVRARMLFERGSRYLSLMLFPVILVVVGFGHEGLQLWLGSDFARHSTAVFQLLALGVFCNSLAQMPFAMVQAAGKPDLTAKLHIVELPLYIAALLLVLPAAGIEGAALAWSTRCLLDMLVLFFMADRILGTETPIHKRIVAALVGAVVVLSVPILASGPFFRFGTVLLTLAAFIILMVTKGLSKAERTYFNRVLLARMRG